VNIDVIRPRDLPENLAQRWARAVEQAQSRYATDDPGMRVAVFSEASEPKASSLYAAVE
jgi:hypothetical protein